MNLQEGFEYLTIHKVSHLAARPILQYAASTRKPIWSTTRVNFNDATILQIKNFAAIQNQVHFHSM